MSASPLIAAISKAARSGPVDLSIGKMRADGGVATRGSVVTHYLRVGSTVSAGQKVVVLRAGRKTIVLTGVTEVG